jgi:microcystin-dependent protein
MLANGALLPIASYSALFALVGTYYGGNGTTNFAVPDLRGRVALGQNGSTFTMGQRAGTENVTILTSNMPSHTHSSPTLQIGGKVGSRGGGGDTNIPTGAYPSAPTAGSMYASTAGRGESLGAPTLVVSTAGASIPVAIRNPYLVLTVTITVIGIFPSRN